MRELVPERGAPVELTRRAGLGRVHGDDATETGAERADHAWQAERPDGEVVVPWEHLDEDRPGRREERHAECACYLRQLRLKD